jgi:hypothetical protein
MLRLRASRLAALALLAASAGTVAAMPVVPGPPSQAAQPAWLAQLAENRTFWRASVNFTTDVYDNFLLWSPSLFIVPQSHIYDRFLYDPSLATKDPAAGWTVGRFLDDLDARYGGVDGVLLWGTYPNMGSDERSQFDLLEDVPGGLDALRDVVAQFNARGVRVGVRNARRSEMRMLCRGSYATLLPSFFSSSLTIRGTPALRGALFLMRRYSRSLPRPSAPTLQTATRWSSWTRRSGRKVLRRGGRSRCSQRAGLL